MRALGIFTAAVAAFAGGTAQAASVEVKDAVARVTVIPEDRSDVKVEFVTTHAKLPLKVRVQGDKTIIDGDLHWKMRGCRTIGGKVVVTLPGAGDVHWDEMPQVVIRTPRAVNLAASGAVFGAVGRAASLELANAGCGDWIIGNVQGRARITQAGSGDTHMGSAGEAKIRIAGSGDVAAQAVRNGLDLDIAGSGDAVIASVSGPMTVRVAGAGDVAVASGAVSAMTVTIAGSGDVKFGGSAQTLKARIAGSGDVRAKAVSGVVDKHVAGSGDVTVG